MPQQGQRLHSHGTDRSEFYYLSDSILWAEAASSVLDEYYGEA